MASPLQVTPAQFLKDIRLFSHFLWEYARSRGSNAFGAFEFFKDVIVDLLYKRRGKYARPFMHVGVVVVGFGIVTVGPWVLAQTNQNPDQPQAIGGVLPDVAGVTTSFYTIQAEEVRQYRGGEVITHVVESGETVSEIAARYGLSADTIQWQNNLADNATLKPGDELEILPVDGIRHKVSRGETIYSVGKKYGLDENQVQAIIDYPFNEFLNDETFELATGQFLIVPGGARPDPSTGRTQTPRFSLTTPDAGSVSASGSFRWPATGTITQGYSFYHRAIDIANRSGGSILAADSGQVIVAGWPDNSGYGNRVIIDHGNGFVTLYAHLRTINVRVGQSVNANDVIGQMGSTGRSTGTHLHFEIRRGSVLDNPLSYLSR